MLIEIESVYGHKLLWGNRMDGEEIRECMKSILSDVGENGFAHRFCVCCGYEEVPYDETQKVNYVIDLDTHKVYKPKY